MAFLADKITKTQNEVIMKRILLSIALALSLTMNAQTKTINYLVKKSIPLLMQDLSEESSYNDSIVKLGFGLLNKNNDGSPVYTNDFGNVVVYSKPVNGKDSSGNEIVKFSMIYYFKETDDIDLALSYLDSYYNSELYDGYALETDNDDAFYFSKQKSFILKNLVNRNNVIFDNAKYYIKERMDKNTLSRGIQLVNKSEGEVEKPYYSAFVGVEQVIYADMYQKSQELKTSKDNQSKLVDDHYDEYHEAKFQGEEEVEQKVSYIRDYSKIIGTWHVFRSENSTYLGEITFSENKKIVWLVPGKNGGKLNLISAFDASVATLSLYDSETKKGVWKFDGIYSKEDRLYSQAGDGYTSFDIFLTKNVVKSNASTASTTSTTKKLAPSMKGIAVTEKSMIGKWRADDGRVFNFMYGKVQLYTPGKQMVDVQTTYSGNGVIGLSAWGMLISQLQVISKTPSTMILYNMETGAKINFSKY